MRHRFITTAVSDMLMALHDPSWALKEDSPACAPSAMDSNDASFFEDFDCVSISWSLPTEVKQLLTSLHRQMAEFQEQLWVIKLVGRTSSICLLIVRHFNHLLTRPQFPGPGPFWGWPVSRRRYLIPSAVLATDTAG